MTDRAIRRAAERKALKAAQKAAHTTQAVSEAQLAANRANARLSTGPATPEGLAISSRNHTTHGLTAEPSAGFHVLPGENQSAYNASLTAFQSEWKPATATEHDLVTRLATHAWLRDRAIRLQSQILIRCGAGADIDPDIHINMQPEDRKQFDLYARYYTTHARAFSKAFSEIMRLKNFQLKQEKDQAILERRALDTQIRFESQKRAAEFHAAKLETIRLKQEAIKQRTNRSPKPEPLAQAAAPHQTS